MNLQNNMGVWLTKNIYGGIAQGDQVDKPATVAFAKNINFRKKHDVVTLNQKLSKDSGTTADALPVWINDLKGTVYSYLQNGKILQRMAASSWVSQKTVSSSVGQGLGVDASYLYYANSSFIGRFPIGGTWGSNNSDTWQTLTGSSWNPIKYFAKVDLMCFGNKGNLAVFDPGSATYSASRLVLPSGWEVRDLNEWGDYMVLSLWTGSTIRSSNRGLIALWDGFSELPNAYIDAQAGNTLITMTDKNFLNVMAGTSGKLYRLNAGELYQKTQLPYLNEDKGEFVDIFPGARTSWKGVPHFGVAGQVSSTSLSRGVFSYGSDNGMIPSGLNMEYTISTGSTGSTVNIGSLHSASNNELYVGWGDNGSYGIDKLDPATQYDTGYFETLQFHGNIAEEGYLKAPQKVRVLHTLLVSGQSVVAKIRRDYNASFATILTSNTADTVSDETTQLADASALPRGRVLQGRVELTSVAGVAPEFISMKIHYDTKPTT